MKEATDENVVDAMVKIEEQFGTEMAIEAKESMTDEELIEAAFDNR